MPHKKRKPRKHSDLVHSANFSPDGTKVVAASQDKTAKIWDAKTGQLLYTLKNHTKDKDVFSASFSADNSKVVTVPKDNTAKIWKLEHPEVTAAEYLIYPAFRYADLQTLPLKKGSYIATIVEKLNNHFPPDRPAIPIQLVETIEDNENNAA